MSCHELLGPDPRQSSCQESLGVVRSCQDPARDSRFAMSRQEFSGPEPRQLSCQESLGIVRTRPAPVCCTHARMIRTRANHAKMIHHVHFGSSTLRAHASSDWDSDWDGDVGGHRSNSTKCRCDGRSWVSISKGCNQEAPPRYQRY